MIYHVIVYFAGMTYERYFYRLDRAMRFANHEFQRLNAESFDIIARSR